MATQIVLRHDVERVGKAGEVVGVAAGFARNFLIPRGLAWPATKGTIKQAGVESAKAGARRARQTQEARTVASKVEKIDCRIKKSAGDQGRLFGAVTSVEIAALLNTHGVKVDRRMITLPEPIKALGVYTVTVKLAPDVEAKVQVLVEKE